MTRGEIKAEVVRRLRESSSSPVFWSSTDVENAVDEGYAEISDVTEWFETYTDILELPAYTPVFDIRQFTQYEFLVAGPAYNYNTSRWLTPEVPRTFDLADRTWENRIAEPEFLMMRGLFWLTYWPFTPRLIKQYYKAIPARFTSDSQEPEFPEQFHYGLVEYALFDLWAQDVEADLAYASWREYQRYEKDLGSFVNGRAGTPKVDGMRPSGNG